MSEAPLRYCLSVLLVGLSNGLLIASIVSISLELLLLLTVSYPQRTQAMIQNMKFVRIDWMSNIAC